MMPCQLFTSWHTCSPCTPPAQALIVLAQLVEVPGAKALVQASPALKQALMWPDMKAREWLEQGMPEGEAGQREGGYMERPVCLPASACMHACLSALVAPPAGEWVPRGGIGACLSACMRVWVLDQHPSRRCWSHSLLHAVQGR